MVFGLGNGRVQVVRGIEDTVSAIREPAAVRVQMGEGCHDDDDPEPTDAIFLEHQLIIASGRAGSAANSRPAPHFCTERDFVRFFQTRQELPNSTVITAQPDAINLPSVHKPARLSDCRCRRFAPNPGSEFPTTGRVTAASAGGRPRRGWRGAADRIRPTGERCRRHPPRRRAAGARVRESRSGGSEKRRDRPQRGGQLGARSPPGSRAPWSSPPAGSRR